MTLYQLTIKLDPMPTCLLGLRSALTAAGLAVTELGVEGDRLYLRGPEPWTTARELLARQVVAAYQPPVPVYPRPTKDLAKDLADEIKGLGLTALLATILAALERRLPGLTAEVGLKTPTTHP